LGKNLGDDLREGKTTLLLIIAMQRSSSAQRAVIQEAITEGGVNRLGDILTIVRETGAMDATRETAMAEARRALDSLDPLEESPFKNGLAELAQELINRKT